MKRILVTGSRDWSCLPTVETAIEDYMDQNPNDTFVVVHGACSSGADRFAELAALELGARIERHPAQWHQFGRWAGPRRNKEMVQAGADVCLAFIRNASRGASGTAHLAELVGIPTIRYTEEGP